MHLTSFGHSCLLVELNGVRVLFDPGTLSHGFEGITGLDAILITHQHPDHADVERLPALVAANPQAQLYCDPQSAVQLGDPWVAANVGDIITVGTLIARATGGKHAVIHPDIPQIDNISFLVGDHDTPGQLYHPGDALFVPEEQVDVLALPTSAPWSKISETIEFARAVKPRLALPIHNALLSASGDAVYNARLAEYLPAGGEFITIGTEDAVELS